jgi:hypothetical protein
MSRIRPTLILALAALGGAALSIAADPAPLLAKDEKKKDDAKDAKKAADLKKDRDAYREKVKKEGKLPFFDLSYAADPVKIEDTRWTQNDPPHPQAEEDKGLQLNAMWSASAQQQGGITVRVNKFIHTSPDGKSVYSYTFEKAGIQCKTAEIGKMTEGFYEDWKKELKDVVEKKCKAPDKCKVGPASTYASVVGTDPEAQKRERRDIYTWLGPNTTWAAIVTISDKYLDDPAIMKKAEEFIGSFKELKAPK